MADNPNQPRVFDAVKGGQTPLPVNSAILGGLEGVKSRLASAVEQQRIAALSEALKYEESGLELVIQALRDESAQVQWTAYSLLQEVEKQKAKKALQKYRNKAKKALQKYRNEGATEILRRYALGERDFTGTSLIGAILRRVVLSEANLRGANLMRANLRWANLKGANLMRANLSEATLSEVDLTGANLKGAILNRADLSEANLSRADLRGTDLSGADLREANLSEAKIKGANLIEEENRILGDGGKRLCQECERLASKKRVGINKNLFLSDLSNK
jgi:uncharacterized protein YjbI with pentapeptide repeats